MRNGIVLMVVILLGLLVAGCNEELCRPTAWISTGPDIDNENNDISGRFGLRNPQGIEFGLQSDWIGIHGENQSYAVYAIGELPETPLGTPYIGCLADAFNTNGGYYGPIAGTLTSITDTIDMVVEYRYIDASGEYAEQFAGKTGNRIYAGTRFRY